VDNLVCSINKLSTNKTGITQHVLMTYAHFHRPYDYYYYFFIYFINVIIKKEEP
jgi:hypothetical protein